MRGRTRISTPAGHHIGRAQMNLGLLYKIKKNRPLAVQHLTEAKWILSQFGRTPIPTSLELFSRIVEKKPTLRVLLIMTYRPEFQPPWLGRPYVTALTINRLTEREAGAMIDRIVGKGWDRYADGLDGLSGIAC
jgi:hypothetical protein